MSKTTSDSSPKRPGRTRARGTKTETGSDATFVPRFVGARVLRREDKRLLTGRGRYVDDIEPPGTLHVAFLRSDRAHAAIRALDTEAAKQVPGVVEVLTAQDLASTVSPMRARSSSPGYQECDYPALAVDKVRMVGEPVAVVIAESRYQAEDGVEAIAVEYDPLPLVSTIESALAEGAPLIHDDVAGNLFNHFEDSSGDVDRAFERADVTVELEVRQQRYTAVPMEGRALIAQPNRATGDLTIWMSSQVPHLHRTGIAQCLGMPENKLRLISPDVGGGFGPKCLLYPDELAVAAAAKKLGRTLKWTSDRPEDLQTTVHGREQIHKIRAAARLDGRIEAVSVDLYASNGAYAPWPFTAMLDSGQASENVTGPYDIPGLRRNVHAVVTNRTPMGPYRGVGRVIACFGMERVMDELAAKLDLDPLEVRRRNLVREFPYVTPAGLELESGDYLRSLDLMTEAIGWDKLRAENEEARARGVYRGLGCALAVEHSSHGPQEIAKRKMEMSFGWDTSSIRVEPDGKVRVAVGLHNHGQGHETTFAQLVADELGVAPDDVEVVYGDTDRVPYGLGTWASRSTVSCGGAAILASRDLRDKMLSIAADMLEANPADLTVADGVVSLKGSPSAKVSVRDVARRAYYEAHLLPADVEPGLDSTRRYAAPEPGAFASSMHAAQVEVDVETGQVSILKYVVVEDCGRVINPMIVEGQIHGGVAQGIGGALLEELVYDDTGQLVTTSLMDYLLPTCLDVPHIDVLHQESPSPKTLGGMKGMGEGGAINSPVVIVAAINDALKSFGVVANHTPITPEWIVGVTRGRRLDGAGAEAAA